VVSINTERRHLLDQIRQHADPEYQAGSMMVTRTQLNVYGVRVPHLRQIARDWQRAHKDISREDLMALVESMWDGESQEERALAMELLGCYPCRIPDLTWDHFERWRRGLDNWGLTDGLGTAILGPWLLAAPDTRLDHLGELIVDEDVWSRRLALVATVPINRGHTGFTTPVLTLKLIDRVKAERHPMITKAVSWALREMVKKHPDQVAAYLEDNREILAAHVVREVNNKLRTGLKSGKAGG
jgi:3-methyladenine DNA glycosylase AlkD